MLDDKGAKIDACDSGKHYFPIDEIGKLSLKVRHLFRSFRNYLDALSATLLSIGELLQNRPEHIKSQLGFKQPKDGTKSLEHTNNL